MPSKHFPYKNKDPLTIILSIIKDHLPEKEYKVFLFGSRAQRKDKPYSDYDIGIIGEQEVPFSQILKIKGELGETPYQVDVVDFFNIEETFKEIAMKKIVYLN